MGKAKVDVEELTQAVSALGEEIQSLYLADAIPWVIGYSGGKDSTATLQLVWHALLRLKPHQLTKPIYVISTDTLVENPIVASWVARSLDRMGQAAKEQGLPLTSHRLTPDIRDRFWVNLIGRGYPAPRPRFRWCTERLKINPSTNFIRSVVQKSGEVILVLGTRKAESNARKRVMARHEAHRTRNRLSPNASQPNSFVYSPIEDWSSDDVWMYLLQVPNPWGHTNRDLLTMYRGASPDGECPLVVDTSTPSCGNSRFGCWVCTMVEKDKSMQAMIQNDDEKEWMLPLLELRDELGQSNDRSLRDFRRMSGAVQLFHDRPIPGPYKQKAREEWLRKVLQAEQHVRKYGPEEAGNLQLISLEEMEEIRRIWVVEKHEIEDSLPDIYNDITGKPYPGNSIDDGAVFGKQEMEILRKICGNDDLHFEMIREMLAIERGLQSGLRRSGVMKALGGAIRRGFYDDEEDAVNRARTRRDAFETARKAGRGDRVPSQGQVGMEFELDEIASGVAE